MFGRPLRDAFSFVNRLKKFSNPDLRPTWRNAWREKESALRQRFHRTSEALTSHARALPPMTPGDRCYIQNQAGRFPKRWDRSGTVVENLGHDSYTIKVDGSGRLTKRNRQFLRKFTPPLLATPHSIPQPPLLPAPTPTATQQQFVAPSSDVHPDHLHPVEPQVTPPDNLANSTVHPSEPAFATTCEPSIPAATPQRENSRPRRNAAVPRRYEPESGLWV